MLKNVKEYLLDKGATSNPADKVRAFLFDELDSYSQSDNSETLLPILCPFNWDDGHPLGLGNSQILRSIFTHLPISDLISLRRVNSIWNNTACEILRTNLAYCKLRPSRLKKFLRTMKKSWCNPFGSYAIRIERLDDPLISKFIRRFPPYIVRLRVKICSSEIPEFTKLLQKMPLLEDLHLIRIPEGCHSLRLDYVSINSAWNYGVYVFPNLQFIRFENDDPSQPFVVNYDTCLVSLINSSINLSHIKFISWNSPLANLFARCGLSNPKSFNGWKITHEFNPTLREDLEDIFFRKELKFKALKFNVDKNIPLHLILDGLVVSKTRDTLYHLSLRNEDPHEEFSISKPFPRLVTLGLKGWTGPVDFLALHRNLPQLATIKLNGNNLLQVEKVEVDPNNGLSNGFSGNDTHLKRFFSPQNNQFRPMKTVETLILIPDSTAEFPATVSPSSLTLAANLFPCVKQLFIQVVSNHTLLQVYECMPQLELLCVDLRGDDVGDEAFTGIPEESLLIREWHECECPCYNLPDDFVGPQKNIGSLKSKSIQQASIDLKTLIIRAGPKITNLSLTEGIILLEKLESLWLLPFNNMTEGDKLTRWCIGAIADRFKYLRRLCTSDKLNFTNEQLQYLKEKLPNLVHEQCESY